MVSSPCLIRLIIGCVGMTGMFLNQIHNFCSCILGVKDLSSKTSKFKQALQEMFWKNYNSGESVTNIY